MKKTSKGTEIKINIQAKEWGRLLWIAEQKYTQLPGPSKTPIDTVKKQVEKAIKDYIMDWTP